MINKAELAAFFQEHSLTDLGLYLDFYSAIVEKVSDGSEAPADHIQVICPELFGKEVYEKWIPQRATFAGKGIGLYAVPNKGDRVNLTFRNGRIHYPFWEYGGWQKDGIPETANGKPQSIILQSTLGQRLELDSDGKVIIHNSDDVHITLYEDKIEMVNGDTNLLLDSDGKINLEVDGYSLKDLIDEILTGIINMKTSTAIGAMPPINVATFSTIKSTKVPQILK